MSGGVVIGMEGGGGEVKEGVLVEVVEKDLRLLLSQTSTLCLKKLRPMAIIFIMSCKSGGKKRGKKKKKRRKKKKEKKKRKRKKDEKGRKMKGWEGTSFF